MVANADKCHLLTSTSKKVNAYIENEIIKNFLQENFLGIVTANRLTFEPLMEHFLKKQNVNSVLSLELLITS